MKTSNAEEIKREIEQLVESNKMLMATKKLMDFAREFSSTKNFEREAIAIKSYYTHIRDEMRIYDKIDDNTTKMQRLRIQILELADLIYESYIDDKRSDRSVDSVLNNHKFMHKGGGEIIRRKTRLEIEREVFFGSKNSRGVLNKIIIEAKGVYKTYKHSNVAFSLLPCDLKVEIGEIMVIVGENGSGKTTLLDILAGVLKSDGGVLRYPAILDSDNLDYHQVKQNIAYIPMNVDMLTRNKPVDAIHYFASIHGIRGDRNEHEVNFILNRLDLDKHKNAYWHELSSGYKMRFILASMLVWHPRLVILDEPLANLDINSQILFLQDLRDLANSSLNPLSVIITSQHLYQVEAVSDCIIVLRKGAVIYNGKINNLGNDRLENVYEIQIDLWTDDVISMLDTMGCRMMHIEGDIFALYTSLEMTENRILNSLIDKGAKIEYFRDISRSVRKLFVIQS